MRETVEVRCLLVVGLVLVASACDGAGPRSDAGPSDGDGDADADPGLDADSLADAEADRDAEPDTDADRETSDAEADGGPPFERPPCLAEMPDVLAERLCVGIDDPEALEDKVDIDCALEAGCLGPPTPTPAEELVVMAYNIERGLEVDRQLGALLHDPDVPLPDVLLLSEVDRGCSRTDGRHVAWEYAEELEMNFVFGVEFVELPRVGGSGGTIEAPCEHGNAILSRFPIGNVELIRHAENESWYDTEEPRLGGRMALTADLLVGDRLLRVYAVHFESGGVNDDLRAAQAEEVAEHGLGFDHRVVVGGDTNAWGYLLDLVYGTVTTEAVLAFLDRGYVDAHAGLTPEERETHAPALVLDLIFVLGAHATAPGICPLTLCPYSDHAPVWATVSL